MSRRFRIALGVGAIFAHARCEALDICALPDSGLRRRGCFRLIGLRLIDSAGDQVAVPDSATRRLFGEQIAIVLRPGKAHCRHTTQSYEPETETARPNHRRQPANLAMESASFDQ